MSLPIVFKPLVVECEVPETSSNPDSAAYKGQWVDGGVLNNTPLHAFDSPVTQVDVTVPELNPSVLCLRPTEGPGYSDPSYPPEASADDPLLDGLGILKEFGGHLLETLLFPSEAGQIRLSHEREQTIDLYTFGLSTLEFAAPPDVSRLPISEARASVLRYFRAGS